MSKSNYVCKVNTHEFLLEEEGVTITFFFLTLEALLLTFLASGFFFFFNFNRRQITLQYCGGFCHKIY